VLRHSADGVEVVQFRELTDMVARITGASVSILPPDRLLQDEFAHPAGPCAHCSHWDDPTRAPCPWRANKSVGDAIRSGTPVVSTCPFGVTQFTVPLLDETDTVAYLVGKQLPLDDESARAGIETVGFDQPRLNPDQWEAGLKLIQMAGKAVTASLRGKGLVPLVSGWPEHKADSGQLLPVILEAHSGAVGARMNSVLILDRSGQRLLPGASRGLPDSYVNALQAVPVGPEEGACGTAAFTGHACIVADMQTDPRWRRYRPLTDPTDLRSCWSVPIKGRNGQVLGTFATYETEAFHPTVEQLRLSHLYAEYARIVIENDRLMADLALRAQAARDEVELMHALTASLDPLTVVRSATLHMAGRIRFDHCRWEAVAARSEGLDTLYEWSDAQAELNWPGVITATPVGLYRHRTAPGETVLETIRTPSEQQPPVTVVRLTLPSGGRVGGVLTLARHGSPFDPEEIRNLERMGRIVALGLGNALSHQQIRHWASRVEIMDGLRSVTNADAHLIRYGVNEQLTATREGAVRGQSLELQTVLERDRGRFAMQAVLTLAKFEEFKDPCTRGHSERVRWTAREVARRLGMSDADVQDVEFAAVLHDLGKVVIPDAILKKPGPLTAAEWQIMRQHPEMGAAILSELDVLSNVVPMVRHHQERWDGQTNGPNPGYPDGLAGDAIPLGARILAVVDAYDAMTSDRPYRRSIGEARARAELIGMAGSQFDPAVVKAALEVMESLTEVP